MPLTEATTVDKSGKKGFQKAFQVPDICRGGEEIQKAQRSSSEKRRFELRCVQRPGVFTEVQSRGRPLLRQMTGEPWTKMQCEKYF